MKNTALHYPMKQKHKILSTHVGSEQFKKMLQLLRFVWFSRQSDFYQKFWAQNKFNPIQSIKRPEDISKIPLLTRNRLIDVMPENRLFVPLKDVDYIRATNTVASGFLTMYSTLYHADAKRDRSIFTVFPRTVKKIFYLRRTESCPPMYIGARLAGRLAIFGNQSDLDWSAHLFHDVNPDAMVMDLPHVFEFAAFIKRYYEIKKIRFIQLYGRTATHLETKKLRQLYKKANIIFTYGSNISGGTIALQCLYLAKKNFYTYHTLPNFIYEGIPLFWSDKPQTQELVITLLDDTPTPLIRYRTGDAVEFIQAKKCRCGRDGMLLRVFGRADRNTLRLTRETIIQVSEIENALRSLHIQYQNFKLRITEKLISRKPCPVLHLHLYTEKKIITVKNLEKQIPAILLCALLYKYKTGDRAILLSELIKRKEVGGFKIYIYTARSADKIVKNEIIDERIG